jgi:TolA-binding protein
MKRRTRVVSAFASAWLASHAAAQSDVLKPFRPEGNKPPPPAETNPVEPKPAERPALKPFRPSDDTPKALPVRPKPVDEPIAPKAVPVKKAPPESVPAPVPTPEAIEKPAAEPPKPKPVTRPVDDSPDPGDIVVKPNASPTAPDQVQLQFADGYYARKMWREAAPEYETYLQRYIKAPAPDRQAAFYRLAECYRQTGAVNNAKANYEAILSNFTGGEFVGYAAYRLASLLYDEKDYRGALPVYRRASVRLTQPTLVNASKFFIGRCLEAVGQKTEARVQYEDLAGIADGNPYRDASRLSAGRLLEEGRQKEAALKWLLPLSKETSNTQIKADALTRAGLLQIDLGHAAEALETLNAALAMPEAAGMRNDLQVGIFRALYEKKDFKGVISRYESGAANELNAEAKLNALVLVANAQRDLGNRDASMALYDQIARDYANTPQARDAAYARLVMLYDTGDQRLLEEVNKFLNDNPAAPQVERVSLMKAEALFKAGNFEHAAPIYQVVVEKSRGLSGEFKGEAAFKLGWCRMQLRQFNDAIPTFTSFLKDHPMHPKVPTALAQLGSAQMQLKQYAAAQRSFEELTTKHPKAREREFGLENLALIHGQLGDPARMASTFEILLRDFPETAAKAKANYWIGRSAYDNKNYKKAATHLDAARQQDSEQFFEKASRAVLACYYNLELLDETEKEIEFYREKGGKAETPSDVIRWLGQKYFERSDYEKTTKHLAQLVIRKEAGAEDFLLLARARARLKRFDEAVESFDSYLAIVKVPVLRVAGLIEKVDAQIGLKDWDNAEKTAKEGLTVATEGKYNGELRLRAGEIEVGRGNVLKALQIFESIPVTLDDDDICPRALERANAHRGERGEDTEVKRLENQLRSKYPEYLQKKKKLAQP